MRTGATPAPVAPSRMSYASSTSRFETLYHNSVGMQQARLLAAAATEAVRVYFADGKGSKKEKPSKDSKKNDKKDDKNDNDKKDDKKGSDMENRCDPSIIVAADRLTPADLMPLRPS